MLRCRALAALGQTGQPAAVELLARVAREPATEGTDTAKQQALDVRIAAVRALGRFSHYQATEALVRVLQTEKDPALRDRAHEALQAATGKKLPPDFAAWDQLLHQPAGPAATVAGPPADRPRVRGRL
jgi:HEAT repeat protein